MKKYDGKGWDEIEMYEAITGKKLPDGPKYKGNDKDWLAKHDAFYDGLRTEMREVFKREQTEMYAAGGGRSHAAKVVREHCKAMHKVGKKWCPYSDVWKAVANIDKHCDHSVLVIADKLLEMMWT